MSGKFDERASLLADGTRAEKNQDGIPDGDRSGVNPDDTLSVNQVRAAEDGAELDEEQRPVTKRDIFKRREAILDKALISAVKTLA